MRIRRRLFPVLVCVLALLLPVSARAQDPQLSAKFQEAYQKFTGRDYAGVLALLEPLRGRPDTPHPMLALLGATYLELNRASDALALLDPVAQTPEAGPALLYNAARAAIAVGQAEKAEQYLERAVRKLPEGQAARALGLRRGRQGRFDEAWQVLGPWIKAHPDDEEARLAAVFAALELGRAAEAEALLAGASKDNPRARLLQGRLLLVKGDPKGAIEALKPLAAGPPPPPPEIERDLRGFLGEAYVRVGQAAEAVALLQGRTGDDLGLTLLLAQALQQTGEPERVLAAVKPVLEPLPDAATIEPARRPVYAALALEQGRALIAGTTAGARWPEAVAALQWATQLDPSNLPAWQVLGQALAGAGRRDEARAALAKFQELSKSSSEPKSQP